MVCQLKFRNFWLAVWRWLTNFMTWRRWWNRLPWDQRLLRIWIVSSRCLCTISFDQRRSCRLETELFSRRRVNFLRRLRKSTENTFLLNLRSFFVRSLWCDFLGRWKFWFHSFRLDFYFFSELILEIYDVECDEVIVLLKSLDFFTASIFED